jgi:hypothetical protein
VLGKCASLAYQILALGERVDREERNRGREDHNSVYCTTELSLLVQCMLVVVIIIRNWIFCFNKPSVFCCLEQAKSKSGNAILCTSTFCYNILIYLDSSLHWTTTSLSCSILLTTI